MDRRRFLQGLAVATVAIDQLPGMGAASETNAVASSPHEPNHAGLQDAASINIDGHALLCEFEAHSATWKVYEDLRVRDGAITFLSSKGVGRVLTKGAEATFPGPQPPYFGMSLSEITKAAPDLLADRLLRDGDPDPEEVKSAVPPLLGVGELSASWDIWNTFLGTKEGSDTMPVYAGGNTRTYFPTQYFPELDGELTRARYIFPELDSKSDGRLHEGLLGGWMPAVRKVIPTAENAYYETLLFADVMNHERYIVHTWHRTTHMVNGNTVKVVYGQDYPAFGRQRGDPEPDAFYRALLEFTLYWEMQLNDFATAALPEKSWVDMSMHAFARELIVRPGGVYPKYGAVDRYYTGSEYDGFQDTFTSALYSNLEWGRFEMAGQVFDNYFSNFVDRKGMVDMRGPETAQFGMTLSLIAKYFNYTRDKTLLLKHKGKIEATAALLIALHDESLQLPQTDPGYGLIHGWCESDSCFQSQPMAYWRPYFANSAFAARGLRDIAYAWATLGWDKIDTKTAKSLNEWLIRSQQLSSATIASIRKNILRDKNPPYIATLPGTGLTFRESLETEHPSLQQWPQRAYSELLQADVLPADLANLVIDCMRAYGGTTLGVVGDVWSPAPQGRVILGFVSYGYALALLRLDRIEEYLLFLYAHRFHAHTRGSWTAAETAHLTGETFLFCMPAQHTIPLLVRWMLVLEDSDADRLYLARGLPRDWLDSGKEIKIVGAPTRWGRVNLRMIAMGGNRVAATVDLASADGPRELHVKFRLPTRNHLHTATVNGLPARFSGPHNDIVIISVQNQRHFEVIAQFV